MAWPVRRPTIAAALLLGGCGPAVDDPGNAPRLGQRARESVEVSGIEREDRAGAKVAATERVRVAYETKWKRIGDCTR